MYMDLSNGERHREPVSCESGGELDRASIESGYKPVTFYMISTVYMYMRLYIEIEKGRPSDTATACTSTNMADARENSVPSI